MENALFHNPTRLLFGRGQIAQLQAELQPYGRRILLVYGGGSIKRSGLYDEVLSILQGLGAQVHELGGVEPNPRLSTVQKGIELCQREQIDLILAVGGGSVIDCVKAIAVGARFDGEIWDVITKKAQATGALPFGTILTLAATGSEMNPGSMITSWETKEKVGWSAAPHSYPTFSICDPTYTFTVPRDQTVYGIVDTMSHVLETYFPGAANTPVQDAWAEGLLRAVMEAAPRALAEPTDYKARETLMYASTMALNRFLSIGTLGDWATHAIEHAVSAVYDIPHGGGLAILFPHWMRYCLAAKPERFAQLAVGVFGVSDAGRSAEEVGAEGIERLAAFWAGIGAPVRLGEYGIGAEQLAVMAAKAAPNGAMGRLRKLGQEDVLAILRLAL